MLLERGQRWGRKPRGRLVEEAYAGICCIGKGVSGLPLKAVEERQQLSSF